MSIAATTRGIAAHWNGPRLGLRSCNGRSCLTVWANIRDWQMRQGWNDIAYNHGVCPGCGRILEGRGWGVRSGANGTTAANSEWHAVMVLSGEGEPFPDAAKAGLLDLHAEHGRRYGRSRLTTHHAVRGGTTACPGEVIRGWVAGGAPSPTSLTPARPAISEEDPMLLREGDAGNHVAAFQRALTAWRDSTARRGRAEWRLNADGQWGGYTTRLWAEYGRASGLDQLDGWDPQVLTAFGAAFILGYDPQRQVA